MSPISNATEKRRFTASAAMLAIICALLAYLTFIPVPSANRDLIVSVLSILLGAGAAAIPNLFGNDDKEKERMREEVASMQAELQALKAAHDTLKVQYDRLVDMLVKRHVVEGIGIVPAADFEGTVPMGIER
jgi:Skp family chaperone for outer membrane proteins